MIYLGKIVKTRSNKGEVVFQPDPNINYLEPSEGELVTLKSPKYQKSLEVEYATEKHGIHVIKFSSISTIEEAFKLIGYSIYATAKMAKARPQKTIIGFKVFDGNGLLWGKVLRVEFATANPLIEVGTGEKTILVPYNPNIVDKIDFKNGKISINPPEGLKSLNSP